MRFILIGVHLDRDDATVDDVRLFDVANVVVSAIAIEEDTSTADPAVLKRALDARAKLLDRATFIAVRYGAPVRSAEDVVERIASRAAKWRELLEKRRGMVEITLKIAPGSKAARPERTAATTGKDYLMRLHEMRRGTLSNDARAHIERAFTFAHESRWLSRQDGGTELVALIARERLDDLRRAGESLRETLADVPFILSGPWPLEVFGEE